MLIPICNPPIQVQKQTLTIETTKAIHRPAISSWDILSYDHFFPPSHDLHEPFEESIKESSYICTLADDWDGEGTEGYTEETWNKAVVLVRKIAQESVGTVPAPRLVPVDDGAIDLLWPGKEKQLVIRIPKDNTQAILSFVSSDYKHTQRLGPQTPFINFVIALLR